MMCLLFCRPDHTLLFLTEEKDFHDVQCCGTVTIFYGSGSGSDF
jgi:hypothetical protein